MFIYTMRACIFDQLTLKGPAESADLKHMCRMNADDFDSYGYMTTIHAMLNDGTIIRTPGKDDMFEVQP